MGEQLKAAPDNQLSLTEPDARSMATSGRGTGVVGYNVQIAVDSKHHMIVAHEVTNVGHDRSALHAMAELAREAIDEADLIAIADRGYYNGKEIVACDTAGIQTLLPKSHTSGNRAKGRFEKQDFRYLPDDDEYECPAGERAVYRFTREEKGQAIRRYCSSACIGCSIKTRCSPSDYRRISRFEYEAVLDKGAQVGVKVL